MSRPLPRRMMAPMDIGNTIRCFTVEPIRDPIPRRHAPQTGPETKDRDLAHVDEFGRADHAGHALTSYVSLGLARRIGG
jgi:hypothetical protein